MVDVVVKGLYERFVGLFDEIFILLLKYLLVRLFEDHLEDFEHPRLQYIGILYDIDVGIEEKFAEG